MNLYRITLKRKGGFEPLVDWYDATTKEQALENHREDLHRYGIPLDPGTRRSKPALAAPLLWPIVATGNQQTNHQHERQ